MESGIILTKNINPKTQNKLYGLDHLRCLAIFLVFVFHYRSSVFGHPEWLTGFARFGWTGVDLFFVLSGFLISSQLFSQIKKGKNISIKEFFLKRFFRIIPVYLIVVGIYFCFPFFREKEALPPLWRFLTFTQNFALNAKYSGTFSHAWSLCVEEHFYFFLPLILILLQSTNSFKKAYWLLPILFLLGFVIRLYNWNVFFLPKIEDENAFYYFGKYIYYPTYNRLDGLLVGVSIAGIYQFLPDFWNKIIKFGNHLIIISMFVLTGAYFVCYNSASYPTTGFSPSYSTGIFGFPLVAVGYGFMVLGAISPASFLYKWNSKTTTLIATLSYAIYLTHKGIIHITQGIFTNACIDKNSNLMLLICTIFCITGALLLNLAIEKPFMKLRDKIVKRK